MNIRTNLLLAAFIGLTGTSLSARGQEYVDWLTTLDEAVTGHLSAGLRINYFELTDPTKGDYDSRGIIVDKSGFLGSITELDENQDYSPLPFVQWHFNPYVALELSYEHLGAKTVARYDQNQPAGSDGSFSLRGFAVTVIGYLPNDTKFLPFAGFGLVQFDVKFNSDELWHNGFGNEADYEAWVEAGRPEWPNNGYQRTISGKDTTGYFLTAGCSYPATDQIVIDLSLRYMVVEFDADYTLSRYGDVFDDRGSFDFPFDNWTGQLGVRYLF